jgi:hypothetical protein
MSQNMLSEDPLNRELKAGIRAFGIKQPFLVKEVCGTEPVYAAY